MNKRKKAKTVVEFDENSKRAFLKGFQQRKQQRIKNAQEKKKEKERLLRLEHRAAKREARKDLLESVFAHPALNGEEAKGEEDVSSQVFKTISTKTTVTIEPFNEEEEEEDR